MKVTLLRTPGKRDFPDIDGVEGEEITVSKEVAEKLYKAGVIGMPSEDGVVRGIPPASSAVPLKPGEKREEKK